MAKGMAMNAVSEFFGSAGGKGDPDLPRQCSELYGLFQRKNIMEAPTDATLRVNVGKPKGLADLEDDKAPGGLFIQHTTSHQWYHCFILGQKEDAQLQCVAMEPDEIFRAKGICGAQACDFDRMTFKTECLTRVVGILGRPQCVYVGHHMELHPKDPMKTPRRMNSMLRINVALLNGHAELLTLLPSSTVQDVMTNAKLAFGKKYLRLVTAKNRVLDDPEKTLEEAQIEDGECLIALVLQPRLAATAGAFALWCHGYSAVVTWGRANFGGDSSAVRDQLKGVQQIQANGLAFAAILEDGSVATWGDAAAGGDSSAVRDELRGVQQIHAARDGAFAAILADGSVVTWGGRRPAAGDSTLVRDQLKGVQQIHATDFAFAATLADGSIVSWGRADFGGDSSAVQDQLRCVQQIQATDRAFAAILADGSVVTWGYADWGGRSSAVQDQLKGVQQIQATGAAFAAVLSDGSIVCWGRADFGGDATAVQDQLRGVQQIQATDFAFAAILEDGSVVTWGHADYGGDSSAVRDQFRVCSRFKPLISLLLRFWKMDLSLLGAMQTMAVTDIMGKPVPYSVYILNCPAALVPPKFGRSSRRRGKDFLGIQSDSVVLGKGEKSLLPAATVTRQSVHDELSERWLHYVVGAQSSGEHQAQCTRIFLWDSQRRSQAIHFQEAGKDECDCRDSGSSVPSALHCGSRS
eukprot:symbB.v1.2.028052.t1/scaffold2932.1/size66953/2